MLDVVTNKLVSNKYVRIIALDLSKAFDTVRHSTLLEKFAMLPIPDLVYNWLIDYYKSHSHITTYCNSVSSQQFIIASVIQGSALGPFAFSVVVSDLRALTKE